MLYTLLYLNPLVAAVLRCTLLQYDYQVYKKKDDCAKQPAEGLTARRRLAERNNNLKFHSHELQLQHPGREQAVTTAKAYTFFPLAPTACDANDVASICDRSPDVFQSRHHSPPDGQCLQV